MKKPTSKKQLAFSTTTVRPLQGEELAQVAGGSLSLGGTIILNPSGGITSIRYNPSGG